MRQNAHIKCKLFKSYLKMIQIDEIINQNLLINEYFHIYYQQDGAPAHNARRVRDHLNQTFEDRCIDFFVIPPVKFICRLHDDPVIQATGYAYNVEPADMYYIGIQGRAIFFKLLAKCSPDFGEPQQGRTQVTQSGDTLYIWSELIRPILLVYKRFSFVRFSIEKKVPKDDREEIKNRSGPLSRIKSIGLRRCLPTSRRVVSPYVNQ
ncbi:hypothetical protein NQ318_019431 [Aromia moschata]|uniref:Uncharacterized protein n=1 Tax=Aromia moschata TaxID=1265417 RepID=A0AAV8Y014_9CUCU|nr:hypothetical protein NQ318_019431 [Aromia moschata]